MLYLIFALAALFLTACGDPDNPVYTAPAGKAVADDEDEVKQPPAPNHGSYEEIPYVPADPPETAAQTLAAEEEEEIPPPLVGNLEQTSGPIISFIRDHRQDFTTGSDARSWKLTAVNLFLEISDETIPPPTYTVEIWTTDGDDMLMEKIGTLTNPSSLADRADNMFTSTRGIDLAANTTYALVVDVTGDEGGINFQLTQTYSLSEDDSKPGWSIADYTYDKIKDATYWGRSSGRSYRMAIHGYAIPLFTQSEVDAHRTDPLPAADNPPEIRQKASRHQQLREDGVLPTISVSGCLDGGEAVFTFSRNGPTTENLAFTFSVDGGNRTISMGFGAGNATREWRAPIGTSVKIEKAYHNYHSGDYIVGTPWPPLTVNSSTHSCP